MKKNEINLPASEIILAELCKRKFSRFVKEFWDVLIAEEMSWNWHMDYLCDRLQAYGENIADGKPKESDLIINISPGTTKSTLVSIMFPVWLWTRNPAIRIITGSHASSLALDMSVKSRDIIKSDKFRLLYPHILLKDDSNVKSSYSNNKGGTRVATSVGSSAIGKHAHVIIVDDPLSANPSEIEINRANDWLSRELATRKVNKEGTPIILIQQRVSHKDTSQYWLSKHPETEHICIPAELTNDVKPITLRDNYKNGLMDEVRLNREVLQDMRNSLGSVAYSAQFLQTPTPTDGGIIKSAWLDVIEEMPEGLDSVTGNAYIDSAYTDDKFNDPSAIIITKKLDNILYVIHAEQLWLEFPQLVRKLKETLKLYCNEAQSRIYIEPKASGKSLVQHMRAETKWAMIEDKPPIKDKETRLAGISPQLEAKRMKLLYGTWNNEYIAQLCAVRPAHDDLRDVTVMAVRNELQVGSGGRGIWTSKKRR